MRHTDGHGQARTDTDGHGVISRVRPCLSVSARDDSRAAEASPPAFQPTAQYPAGLMVGLDVGSTTVKAVVVEPVSDTVLWRDYRRHETRQAEMCLQFLDRIRAAFPHVPDGAFRVFATGSGSAPVARHIGARFVQEVNAVALAVEKLHPEVHSVIELGGQDAKIIVFKDDPRTGRKKKIPSMNDKCAGGTGAVIDKINAKLRIPGDELRHMGYDGVRLHPVAGKCGVFAETDINGLQKQGVPADELMASLFESIVQQNLTVLTRGHTLRPVVLLLGGPNYFVKGMAECWRKNIPLIWKERHVPVPEDKPLEELIVVPEDAQYFAALGAVAHGLEETGDDPDTGVFTGTAQLRWYLDAGRKKEKQASGRAGLSESEEELAAFRRAYTIPPWEPAHFTPGTVVEAFVGVDGGSTSTKAVLIDHHRNILAKAYQLSQGNPIEDCKDMFADLDAQVSAQGCTLKILGVATTGYAKDILRDVIGADVALVETVAHTRSGLHFHPDADVICDVGGQDIKIIILRNGAVKDFKLNTQCSAGNGYFLQSTAADFGYSVEQYADAAFQAEAMPDFGYGCAVFMQSDIVDFQRQGWRAEEIMAGLAAVLPKNIWLYVSQVPNLPKLGRTFILQGGTQRNLAAVKAQVDFIRSRFRGTGIDPVITVHHHCGEAGAIGCAFEAHRLYHEDGRRTTFIGLDAVRSIAYRTTRNENTRCGFCKNKCVRTFIDVKAARNGKARPAPSMKSKVPLDVDEQRLIIATCEKGGVEDLDAMKAIKQGLDDTKKRYPNLVERSAKKVFLPVATPRVADPPPVERWFMLPATRKALRARRDAMARRATFRIGMPRVLNMYGQAPFFMAYFQALGLRDRNIVWSDVTTEEGYKEGAKRGSIDPCFPSKVAIAHVHNLLQHKHTASRPLDAIFFPMVDSFPTWLNGVADHRACPTAAVTPESVHAAFVKEGDLFAERGLVYKKTFLNLDDPALCARQMHEDWHGLLGISEGESRRAVHAGLAAMAAFHEERRREARKIIDALEAEDRIGIVVLARPYHNDPGISHGIAEAFQKLGYPVLTIDSLPLDEDLLDRLFGEDLAAGRIRHPLDIDDAWKNSYSENTSRKIWAAKFVARHPNLVALEISNFKCGHDAPIYTVVEEIIERSGTPFFYFKDIDENRPAGSMKIRVETIAYFLERHRETLLSAGAVRREIERRLKRFEEDLRSPGTEPRSASVA